MKERERETDRQREIQRESERDREERQREGAIGASPISIKDKQGKKHHYTLKVKR